MIDPQMAFEPKISIPQITSSQVLDARKIIEELRGAIRQEWDDREKEVRHLKFDVYYHMIKKIEDERDDAVRKIEAARDEVVRQKEEEIGTHSVVVDQAHRIFEMLRLPEGASLDISEGEVDTRDGTIEDLGYLINDEYLVIKLFIITNKKPTNKYSLVAVGRSIFGEPLIKWPYDYGVDLLYTPRRYSILLNLKESHDTEILKGWFRKRGNQFATATLIEYQKLKIEYVATRKQYKIGDLKELVTHVCPQCNNFWSIFDYAEREPQCYRHDPYVKMVKA